MGFEFFAKKLVSSAAVEALSAELRVICNDSFADGESLHLGAKPSDNANRLMTYKLLESFSFSSHATTEAS
jgi:hypothetical protein